MSATSHESPAAGESRVPWSDILNRQYGPLLALVALGVWLHAADTLLVSTMMPAIIADIGGASMVSWTITLYEVGTITIGAISGLLALRHGLRKPMSLAAIMFATGCTVSALSTTMSVMLIGRLLQGAGGGGLMALSFVAVGILFEKRLIARVMAVISMLWGASAFVGPMIGAFFVEYASWRAGFWIFALQALALAGWIAFGRNVQADTGRAISCIARTDTGVDARGNTISAETRMPLRRLFVLSMSVLLIASAGVDVSMGKTTLLICAGFFCLGLFIFLDQRRDHDRLLPGMPRGIFSAQGSALLMILCFAMGNVALPIYGTLFMTAVHGSSVLLAGYVVASPAIAWTLFAVALSGSAEKNDATLIAIGMLLVFVGMTGLVWAVPNGPVWAIAGFGFLQGGGFGMAWTFLLRRLTSLSPPAELERVASAVPTVQTVGLAFGAAYAGILANAAGFAEGSSAEQTADVAFWTFLGCIPIAMVGMLAMGLFVRMPNSRHSQR